ncbi:MAG: phosphatase PAP2 family protein [Candidatus Saccharimonadales bacterium]
MKNKTHKIKITHPTIQLFAALVLFVATVLASRGSQMTLWEISLFRTIYSLPDFLHAFFIIVTQLGSIYVLGLLLVLYIIKQRYQIVLRLLLTGTLAYMASGVAKDMWGRMRPHEFLPDIVSLEYVVRGPGFPSGHMALATALAFTMGHYLPKKYRWLLVTAVIGVGLSRMYLGVHAPLDIIGGFAIGWASYALFRHVRLYGMRHNSKPQKKKTSLRPIRTAKVRVN